jgi:hypothetical protein
MADAKCLGCGGTIRLEAYQVPAGVIARGDRLMHEGCVINSEAQSRKSKAGCPAYFIPRNW